MNPSPELIRFFLREFEAEELNGFIRLSRIPDSHVVASLAHYKSLRNEERSSFRDCCAHWAHACYGFVIGAPRIDHTRYPYFHKWRAAGSGVICRSVPLLRAEVQQYQTDTKRGIPSCISPEQIDVASSIHAVEAPQLRKRVRAALKPVGYHKVDELGYYRCRDADQEFFLPIDFGGRSAQLRYCVAMPEFSDVHPLNQFCFERALGFGFGDWNYIVEENVDDAMSLFAELVRYCVTLPSRIRAAVPRFTPPI